MPNLLSEFTQVPAQYHSIGSNCNWTFSNYWSYIYNFLFNMKIDTIDGTAITTTLNKNLNNFCSFDVSSIMKNYFKFSVNMGITGFAPTSDMFAYNVAIKPNLGDDRTGYTYNTVHYAFNAKAPITQSDLYDINGMIMFHQLGSFINVKNEEVYLSDDYTLRIFNNGATAAANAKYLMIDVTTKSGIIRKYRITNTLSGSTVNSAIIQNMSNNLLDIGVGPHNLNNISVEKLGYIRNYLFHVDTGNTYDIIGDGDHYCVYLANAQNQIISQKKTFVVKLCKNRFEKPIQLAFNGLYGGIEYVSFVKNSEKKTSITSKKFYRSDYAIDSVNSYMVNNINGGFNTYNTEQQQKYFIQSDWMLDEDSKKLEQVLYSDDVYVKLDDGVWRKCIITDTEYVTKTIARNRLFSLQLNIQISSSKFVC